MRTEIQDIRAVALAHLPEGGMSDETITAIMSYLAARGLTHFERQVVAYMMGVWEAKANA